SARAAGGLSGRDLFVERRCVTCHGTDGTGGAMGPALGVVMPEYLSAAGGDEREAKRRLVEYLREPQKVPVLRKGTMRYPNPMPSAKGLGLSEEELERVADFVLHLKPPSVSTGGDGGGGK
ncbi:MAG: cytochrome c, partial [Planctomycetaceae bacterium]|nr:cytochrome c [Planctomycetaceae bacterium]